MTREDQISIMKAAIWEEAKGKLRALAAVAGQCNSTSPQYIRDRYDELNREVEAFIVSIEENALHE